MKAIITGDIVNSRSVDAKKWLLKLKKVLNLFGNEPKDWEIYRGDSSSTKTHSGAYSGRFCLSIQ